MRRVTSSRKRSAPSRTMSSLAEDIADDVALENLGYKQELTRGMTMLCVARARARAALRQQRARPLRFAPCADDGARRGSIGITLGCMQPLLSGGVLQLGMLYGGAARRRLRCRGKRAWRRVH